MTRPFNDGIRVLWASGGDPIFRDHTGRKRVLSVRKLHALRDALRSEAAKASEARCEREFVAYSTLYAEADLALKDTIQCRMAAKGLFLVTEDAA